MLWMRSRTRVINLKNFRMLFEKRGDGTACFVVLFHAQGQRLRAAQDEPRVERRQNSARTVLYKADPRCVFFVVQDNYTADPIGMTVQILGSGMHNDIDTKLQRTLQVWRHER